MLAGEVLLVGALGLGLVGGQLQDSKDYRHPWIYMVGGGGAPVQYIKNCWSPKFIWASCAQLYSFTGWDAATPHPPALGLLYEGAIGQLR